VPDAEGQTPAEPSVGGEPRPDWLRFTPGLRVLAGYERRWLRPDLIAGLVLAAILLPVGMAYAELAGLPPVVGLYASLVPLFVYAVFGPSRPLVVGPDSATASLVGAAIIPLAFANSPERIALAGMLALLVGAMCLAVGVGRLGFVTSLLSKPVRIGYMNGIAIVVIVSQLPKLFGFRAPAEGVIAETTAFARAISLTNWVAFALGAGSLVLVLLLRAFARKVPGPIIVVAASTIVTAALDLTRFGVAVVGRLPEGLPRPAWPAVGLSQTIGIAGAALGIAIISLTDTTVLSSSFASRFGYSVNANEEFVAVGVSNVAAGLFQGFPVSGSQTRSALNKAAGAKTPLSGVVAGVVLGVLLVALPWLLSTLPISVLAAIVITAGVELSDVRGTVRLWHLRRTEFALSLISFVGVIVFGVLPGVFVAVALSVLNFMRRQWWPHDAVMGRVPGVKGYHDIGDFDDAGQVPGLLLWRFDAPLFFANAGIFRQRLLARIAESSQPVRWVVICAEPIIDVDTTAADLLAEFIAELCQRGIVVGFAELKSPVREHLQDYGLVGLAGSPELYPTIGSAVHAYVRATGVDWVDWEDADAALAAESQETGSQATESEASAGRHEDASD
jgi:high affinity sulfate transporter 1